MSLSIKYGFKKFKIDNQNNFIVTNLQDVILLKVPLRNIAILYFEKSIITNKPIILVAQGYLKTIKIECRFGAKKEHTKFFNYMHNKCNFLNLSYSEALMFKHYNSYNDCLKDKEYLKKEGSIFKQNILDRFRNLSYLNNDINVYDSTISDHIYNIATKAIFIESNLYSKLEDFIMNNTWKYDINEMNEEEYDRQLRLFIYYLSKFKSDNEPIETNLNKETLEKIADSDTVEIIIELEEEILRNIEFDNMRLRKLINFEKVRFYKKELINKLDLNNTTDESEVIDKYIDYYGDKCLLDVYILALSKYLEKDIVFTENTVKNKYNKILNQRELLNLENNLFGSRINEEFYTIEYIDSLDGFEFEDYLEELFKSYGYTSEKLPYSNDYGADLIISKGNERIVIQAKNYSNSVGNGAVQEVISAKSYYKCEVALVITNSTFTRNAIEMANKTHVILIDRFKLIEILNKGALYFNSIVT